MLFRQSHRRLMVVKSAQVRIQKLKVLYALLLKRKFLQIRFRSYLTSQGLQHPDLSSWHDLYANGSDINLLNTISLTRAAFEDLLASFSLYYSVNSGPGKSGRPRKLKLKSTVLGLLLQFYTATVEHKTLCQMYGVPPATLSRVLNDAEIALNETLLNEPLAAVKWPTLDQQLEFGRLVELKHADVRGRWGFVDGKNYRVKKPTNVDLQNSMYNGWLHATLITGVLCFSVEGCVIWGKHNVVGSWNDGEISRKFQHKLLRDDINLPGHGVLSDSAFPVAGTKIACFLFALIYLYYMMVLLRRLIWENNHTPKTRRSRTSGSCCQTWSHGDEQCYYHHASVCGVGDGGGGKGLSSIIVTFAI
jgi:hypothetical protein